MSGDLSSSDKVNLNIRCSNGSKFSVEINLDSSVSKFKDVLAQNCDISAEQQRLIYKGRVLKDDQTLNSYGLQADHTVHMVRGLPAASTNTTAAVSGGARNDTPNHGVPAGLFDIGLEIPNFGQTQNPDIMRDIMNMPAVQNLMSNGDIVRDFIMSNPQMREIIDRNPELAHILNDPATLQQTLEASRNPELMREMMRNTDRAMSNIEASPEGFNMLRRMYETVQEPLLNASTMAGNSGDGIGSDPLTALLGNHGGSQTRDTSINSSATGAEQTTGSLAPNTNPLPNPWGNAGAAGAAQRNTARSTPAGGTPGIGGLSGLGLPEMDQIFRGMQDPSGLNQFVQSPAVSQLMQSLLSDPQSMNQILGPQLRNMLDSNPQLRETMQNPDFLSHLTSPETLQQMSSLQQSLLSFSRQPTTQEPIQSGTGAVPAEQLYANQLSQLQEMGFFDTQENIRALSVTAGNVHAAVERLLGNPGQ